MLLCSIRRVPPPVHFYITLQQHSQNKILHIYSHLKTASVCTKTTIKSASVPLHASGEGRGPRGRAAGEVEVG